MRKLFFSGLALFIVCFNLGCITWFGFEKQNNKLNVIDKTYNDAEVNHLDIDSRSSNVTIAKGNKFAIHYKGQQKVDINKDKQSLNVKETSNRVDNYGLNYNPFRQIKAEMKITIPNEKLKELKVSSKARNIKLQNIKADKVDLNMSDRTGSRVYVQNSEIEKMLYRGLKSPIHISDSKIVNANIKTKDASIYAENALIKNSVLLAQSGHIQLDRMDIDSAFKASTQNGDIIMSYNKKPDNTLLKLNPDDGVEKVNNKSFDNDRVGEGDNILEFYTVHGDIHIN